MINFFHNFEPQAILVSIGPFSVYWYGFFIVCGILAGSFLILKLSENFSIDKNTIIDSAFWVVLASIIGARIYHIFLEFGFYLSHPLNIFKLWQGGLAIHGAIIGGTIALAIFTKKRHVNLPLLTALYVPALSLGQAFGRWGNYFNQELFGRPTNLPWGIPIKTANRPLEFIGSTHFQPTFFYESIANLFICLVLLLLFKIFIKKNIQAYSTIVASYLFLYSCLRFGLEYIRIDSSPEFFGLRVPQIASIILIIIALVIINKNKKVFLGSPN